VTLFLPSLVGATCSGKTQLACRIAERLSIEVVGADSRQIYRGFDKGTAKPSDAERAAVVHHGIDIADPRESFSAGRFARFARDAAEKIAARGCIPVLVGGSGLYLRAAEEGLFHGPPASPAVRRRLEDRARREGVPALHAELARVDASSAERVHPHDLVRVVRALEVCELTGEPLSAHHARHRAQGPRARRLAFGIRWETDALARRIESRVDAMLADGWVEEVERLVSSGVPDDAPAWNALGYREVRELARGTLSRADARDAVVRATKQLAKRQRTWFRAVPDVAWFSIETEKDLEAAAREICERIARGRRGAGT
jgi:tRNA dimethylallyltransferase